VLPNKVLHETFSFGDGAKAHPNLNKAAQIEIVNDAQYMTFSRDVLPQSAKKVRELSDEAVACLFELITDFQRQYPNSSAPKTASATFDSNFEESKTYPREADGLLHKNRHHATVQEAGRAREQKYIFLDGCVRDQKSAPLSVQEWYDYITEWREKNVFDCHSVAQDEKVWSMAQWTANLAPPTWLTLNMKVTEAEWAQFQATLPQPSTPTRQAVPVDVSNWRGLFRNIGEMEDGPIDMIIHGVLQEGTCFLGALPASGKTLVSLAFAKAISTGEPLFGLPQYSVQKPRTVFYLIPESRDRAFRKRCESFRLPNDDRFLTRTISAGAPLDLSDARLLEAVRQTKGVVFLDTASRFMRTNDENSAAQNRMLVNDVVTLLSAGAVCVVLVHHATKDSKKDDLNLENALRGTSDFGAMCDQAYGVRKDDKKYKNGAGPLEIDLVSLKDREQIGGLTSIRLAATWKEQKQADGSILQANFGPVSYIDTTGNFRVISETEAANKERRDLEALVAADPNIPTKELAAALRIGEYRVKSELARLGYHRVKGGPDGASPWHKDGDGKCPYDKANVVEIKPAKKTFDLTLDDAKKKLADFLKGSRPEGPTITESDVLQWADREGIKEAVLTKARKRLGVVVDKRTKNWSLPAGGDASGGF
jgi:hypothetical protein